MRHSYRLSLNKLFDFGHYKLFDFFVTKKEVRVSLKNTRKTGTCPICNKQRRKSETIYERCIRDLDVSGRDCFIYFTEYKIRCACGYRGIEKIEFVDKYSIYTNRFEEFVAMLCRTMCIKDVSETAKITWHRAKEIDKKYLSRLVTDLKSANPRRIGIDEIAYEKRHKYLTVVRDIDIGRVIWVGRGRKKETLDGFFAELGAKKSKRIEAAVIDMWNPYIKSIRENAPQADIVFDKFHIAKKVNEAVDKVRRKEFAKASKEQRIGMKRKRFLVLRRNKNLSIGQKETLNHLMETNTNLYKAYLLKEHILDILDGDDPERLTGWLNNVAAYGSKEFTDVADTIKRYIFGIVNYFKHRLTNAASEAFNNKINVIKRRAFGFRDLEYFMLKILQCCGNLS